MQHKEMVLCPVPPMSEGAMFSGVCPTSTKPRTAVPLFSFPTRQIPREVLNHTQNLYCQEAANTDQVNLSIEVFQAWTD